MAYQAKQTVCLSISDFLSLEFFLMDTCPGAKPGAFVAELVKRWLETEMARLASPIAEYIPTTRRKTRSISMLAHVQGGLIHPER